MVYRILIVEDEYWTARNLAMEVQDRGAIVIGPTSSVPKAIELLSSPECPHVVIMDIQLRTEDVFPLADVLLERQIPFLFATGYEVDDVPDRFAGVPHFVKPVISGECVEMALSLAAAKAAE